MRYDDYSLTKINKNDNAAFYKIIHISVLIITNIKILQYFSVLNKLCAFDEKE